MITRNVVKLISLVVKAKYRQPRFRAVYRNRQHPGLKNRLKHFAGLHSTIKT
jgi:hypothetical protein